MPIFQAKEHTQGPGGLEWSSAEVLFGQKSDFDNLAASWSTVVYIRRSIVDLLPVDIPMAAFESALK